MASRKDRPTRAILIVRYSRGLRTPRITIIALSPQFRGYVLSFSHEVSPTIPQFFSRYRVVRLGNVCLLFREKRSITTVRLYTRENNVTSLDLETVLSLSYNAFFSQLQVYFSDLSLFFFSPFSLLILVAHFLWVV